MEINKQLAKELEVQEWQVDAAVKLIDEGNTIPFISRYRKEATGSLNDEVLRKLFERLTYLRNLEEKKQQVLSVIEEQISTAPIVRNGGPERRSRRKKVWSPWQISSACS